MCRQTAHDMWIRKIVTAGGESKVRANESAEARRTQPVGDR